MERNSDNIFDYVDDFYSQDPEWDNIIHRSTCENYLRKKIWQGTTGERLINIWDYILCFALYCGNADVLPGDMTADDCIQCVGWCARNVAEFNPDNDYIRDFMEVIADFYEQLKAEKAVTQIGAMALAQKMLFADGDIILTQDGYFQGKFERFNSQGIPNLNSYMFINLSEQMMIVTRMLEGDFVRELYPKDFQRAKSIYTSLIPDGIGMDINSDARHAFADYFCFDYKLLATGKPLIEDLAKKINNNFGESTYSRPFKILLKELAKAKLSLFVVKKDLGGGTYSVVDILRNQSKVVVLPFVSDDDIKEVVLCGHIFCDDTMVVNFLRGCQLTDGEIKHLQEMLKRLKEYYAVRKGGKCTWDEFIANNQLLVRSLPVLIASKMVYRDDFGTDIHDYRPAKLVKGDMVKPILSKLFPQDFFSPKDVKMALQIWADIQAKECPDGEEKESDSTLLAIAVSRIYIKLCGVYGFKDPVPEDKEMQEMQDGVNVLIKEMTKWLDIKKFDPRYVNEEGMLLMLIKDEKEKSRGRRKTKNIK